MRSIDPSISSSHVFAVCTQKKKEKKVNRQRLANRLLARRDHAFGEAMNYAANSKDE